MSRQQSVAAARRYYREQVHAGQAHIGTLVVPLSFASRPLDCSQLQSLAIECQAASKCCKPWTHIVVYAEDSPQSGAALSSGYLRSGETFTFGFLHSWQLMQLLGELPPSSSHLQLQRSQVLSSLPTHSLHHDFALYRIEMPHAPEALRSHSISLLIHRRAILLEAALQAESTRQPLRLPEDARPDEASLDDDWDDGCVTPHVQLGSWSELLAVSSARAALEDFASHRWFQSLLGEDAHWWSIGCMLQRHGSADVVASTRQALAASMPCGPKLAENTLDNEWLASLRKAWLDGECALLKYRLMHSATVPKCLPATLPPYATWISRERLLQQVASLAARQGSKAPDVVLGCIAGREEDDAMLDDLGYDQPKAYVAGDAFTVLSRCSARWRSIVVHNGAGLVPVAHACEAIMLAFRKHEEASLDRIKRMNRLADLAANKFRRCNLRELLFMLLRERAGISQIWAQTGRSIQKPGAFQSPLVPRANAGSATLSTLRSSAPSCIASLLHDLEHPTQQRHLNVERRKLLSRFAAGLGVKQEDIEDIATRTLPRAYGAMAAKESKGVLNDLRMAYREGAEQYGMPTCNKLIQCNACPKVSAANKSQLPPQALCCRELNHRIAFANRPAVRALHTPAFYVQAMQAAKRRAAEAPAAAATAAAPAAAASATSAANA